MFYFKDDEFCKMVEEYNELPDYKWFDNFNKMTGGFYNGQLLLIGGATNAGKTMLACNILHTLASNGNVVGYITTETRELKVLKRIMSRGRDEVRNYDLNVYDSSTKPATRRVACDIYSPKYYGDALLENDIVLFDYIKTDARDALEGSRELRSVVDDWSNWAIDNDKVVVMFAQLKDWRNDQKGEFSGSNDFWFSTAITQPADTVMCVRRVGFSDGKTKLACDIFKNRTPQDGEIGYGRFLMDVDVKRCEIVNQGKIVSEEFAKDLLKKKETPSEKFRRLALEARNETL